MAARSLHRGRGRTNSPARAMPGSDERKSPDRGASAPAEGREGEAFVEEICREVTGQVGVVERRAYLDHIHGDQAGAGETAHERECLAGGEAAGDRRAGAGREGGVDAVDVEGDVERAL